MFNRPGSDVHSVMLHVLKNPSQYGPETVKEMTIKAVGELHRLWGFETDVKVSASEIKYAMVNILGKEQA